LITHRRLTEAARDWEALNRDDGALYRGARLAGAQDWARDHASELGILERDFLAASNAIEQRELASARRRTRRLGVLAGGLAVLSAIVFGLALVAFSERNAVREQRDTAQADRLATDALSHLEADPGRSLESAMRSYTTKPTPLAEASLRAAASRATPQVVIRGHQAAVSGIAVARDGRHIASVDEDGTIRVHDWRARNEPAIVLRDTDGTVNAMTFTSDGRRLVILGNRLRVWNWREPHAAPVSARLPGEPGSAVAIEEGGRHVASVGADAAVRIWDLRRRPATPTVLRGRHTEQVDALEITKRWLASADRGGTVRVWDRRASGNKPIVFRARGRPSFSSLGFSPDGQHLAAATNEGTVLVWDLRRRRSAATTLHDIPHSSIGPVGATFGTTVGAAFSIDGRYVASMSLVDGTVHVWELRRPRLAPVALRGHEGYGAAAAFADNGHVVSAGGDGTVRVWDWRAQRTRVTELRGHQGFVTGVVFSADGRRLASGDLRGEIRVWDWRKPRLRSIVLPSDGMAVGDLALSDDSRRVASATYDGSGRSGRRRGTLRVWDLNMPRPVPIVLGERDVSQLTFSDDAEHLAAVDADAQTVLVWDLTAPRRRPAVMARSGDFAIKSIVFTDHGRRLVGASDGAVLVWDWRARTHAAPTIHRLPRESAEAVLALAGDGRHLARGLDDGTVHIIDWRAPARAPIVLRGALTAGSIAFAGDGLSIAAAADGLFVWDWRAPSVPPTVLAPSSGRLLAITPDGRYIASGGFDRAVHLYACEQCGDIEHVLRLARARAPIHLKG
jgi:WD40 repeat protein